MVKDVKVFYTRKERNKFINQYYRENGTIDNLNGYNYVKNNKVQFAIIVIH